MDNPKSFSDREFGPEVEVAVQIQVAAPSQAKLHYQESIDKN